MLLNAEESAVLHYVAGCTAKCGFLSSDPNSNFFSSQDNVFPVIQKMLMFYYVRICNGWHTSFKEHKCYNENICSCILMCYVDTFLLVLV